jgi:hypothetical protein
MLVASDNTRSVLIQSDYSHFACFALAWVLFAGTEAQLKAQAAEPRHRHA